jgi:8-oxo-dGTP diphosphatase
VEGSLEDTKSDGTPLRVVAAVIIDKGEILACRRNANRAAGGLWEFPGGKIEPGESPEAAIAREIREELDVSISVDGHLTSDITVVAERAIELICLRSHLDEVRPLRSSDHDKFAWLSPGDLERLTWAAPDLPAVRLLVAEARTS